jgi:hypothetical protein
MSTDAAVTGTDRIRTALRARHGSRADLARECHVSILALDAFAQGDAALPTEIMNSLVAVLSGGHIDGTQRPAACDPSIVNPRGCSVYARN